MRYSRFGVLSVLFVCLFQMPVSFASEKKAIGWLEYVEIADSDLKLKAKIDTGATTSSLNAKIIKKFKKNGEKWIRFSIENNIGEEVLLERKVVRYVKIKRKLAFSLKRPVINLGICLGKIYQTQEINLADRNNFNYQILIGRNYLKNYFLVDSAIEYTTKPLCKEYNYNDNQD